MRKENQVDEATTDATEDAELKLQMSAAGQAYMKATGMTQDDVQQSLDAMSAALKAMPKTMDPLMMGYFIHNLLNAYDVAPATRIELFTTLVEQTVGANVWVLRLREGADGNVMEVDSADELICDCPKCTAEREAESRVH